jgi:hypothetical protein
MTLLATRVTTFVDPVELQWYKLANIDYFHHLVVGTVPEPSRRKLWLETLKNRASASGKPKTGSNARCNVSAAHDPIVCERSQSPQPKICRMLE